MRMILGLGTVIVHVHVTVDLIAGVVVRNNHHYSCPPPGAKKTPHAIDDCERRKTSQHTHTHTQEPGKRSNAPYETKQPKRRARRKQASKQHKKVTSTLSAVV